MIGLYLICGVRLYGEGLRRALDGTFRIAGLAPDAGRALADLRTLPEPPAVILLDVTVADGLAGTAQLRRELPGARVVAFGVRDRDKAVIDWIGAGASGFVSRESSLDDLVAAIEAAARGENPCPPDLVRDLFGYVGDSANGDVPPPERRRVATLTRREREILGLVGEGLSNKQIAGVLHIELPTVKNHVHHAIEKLAVHGRSEAAELVRRSAD